MYSRIRHRLERRTNCGCCRSSVGRGRPELHDPRLRKLLDYDREHAANLSESVHTYLQEHGDVRNAATALQVHPNTLRYRICRVEDIVGMDLTDPADRLLLELQLALHRRSPE